jgi:hypothetical protein
VGVMGCGVRFAGVGFDIAGYSGVWHGVGGMGPRWAVLLGFS